MSLKNMREVAKAFLVSAKISFQIRKGTYILGIVSVVVLVAWMFARWTATLVAQNSITSQAPVQQAGSYLVSMASVCGFITAVMLLIGWGWKMSSMPNGQLWANRMLIFALSSGITVVMLHQLLVLAVGLGWIPLPS